MGRKNARGGPTTLGLCNHKGRWATEASHYFNSHAVGRCWLIRLTEQDDEAKVVCGRCMQANTVPPGVHGCY
jgi:hypothetical protein